MRVHARLLCGTAALAILGLGAPSLAQAQTGGGAATSADAAAAQPGAAGQPSDQPPGPAASPGATQPGTPSNVPGTPGQTAETGVVVTGIRASLQSAQAIKQRSSQIVDSIVAEDIGKLPAINTAEALQRITGIQINRDLGEGSTVVVRGVSQVETLLNGREVFTAAGTRTLNFEFIPAELLSGIDVYKTNSPDLIEGGLGGTINVKTRRPFDFKGFTLSGSLMGIYGDLVKKTRPEGSLLISNRWTTSVGEVGALISVSDQTRALREDQIAAGAPTCFGTVVAGVCGPNATYATPFIGPNGFFNPQFIAERKRIGVDGALQWRPMPNLELYLDASYERFETDQRQRTTFLQSFPGTAIVGAPTLYSGTNILRSATIANVAATTNSVARDTIDANKIVGGGFKWSSGPWAIRGDISYVDTIEDLYFRELDLRTVLPRLAIDTSTSPPAQAASGINLADISNYNFAGMQNSVNHWKGHEGAGQLDVDYNFEGGPITRITAGARYAKIGDTLTPIRFFSGTAGGPPAVPASRFPGIVMPYDLGYPFQGSSVPLFSGYLIVNPEATADIYGIANLLGISPAALSVIQSQSIFTINETDYAGYVKANFDFTLGLPIDGNIGVRVVRTKDQTAGTATINSTVPGGSPTFQPINISNEYTNVLPSFNARVHLQDNLFFRLAASKSVTRPEFSQLNPGLTLVPGNLTGSQGNPNLQPFTANNYDAALEWYFARTGSLYGTAFYKTVKGFVFTRTVPQNINGQNFLISQPVNSGSGKVKGVEVGYQQFYGFLPDPFSGLGLQANVTYISSSAPTSVIGFTSPLPNLSKWSYNVIGLYERGPISARIAYNWRDKFVQGIGVASGVGVVPTVSKAFGWLDAAFNYDINRHLTFTIEGSNLLRTKRETYIGSPLSPNATFIDDRQVIGGFRFKW